VSSPQFLRAHPIPSVRLSTPIRCASALALGGLGIAVGSRGDRVALGAGLPTTAVNIFRKSKSRLKTRDFSNSDGCRIKTLIIRRKTRFFQDVAPAEDLHRSGLPTPPAVARPTGLPRSLQTQVYKRCSCLLSLLQTKETYRASIWATSGDPRPARVFGRGQETRAQRRTHRTESASRANPTRKRVFRELTAVSARPSNFVGAPQHAHSVRLGTPPSLARRVGGPARAVRNRTVPDDCFARDG
jgi:hypothetical protein